MTTKRLAAVLLALAACCVVAACTNPAPAAPSPSSTVATPVAPAPEDPPPQPEETGAKADNEKEETAMDQLYVADAARYRGTVASIDADIAGGLMYRLTAFPGSGLPEQLMIVFTGDSKTSFPQDTIQEGDHLEVFYQPVEGETCGLTCYEVIAANRLLPAEGVYYNGILVEQNTMECGTVDLVMVPQDTPMESWGDPMKQFVFHTGPDTQFYTSAGDLKEGALLNIYHKGIATRSLPPQGVALEVRLLAQ